MPKEYGPWVSLGVADAPEGVDLHDHVGDGADHDDDKDQQRGQQAHLHGEVAAGGGRRDGRGREDARAVRTAVTLWAPKGTHKGKLSVLQ